MGELRAKQAAAKSMKGVVGSKGKKIPTTPITKLTQPKIKTIRLIKGLVKTLGLGKEEAIGFDLCKFIFLSC